MSCIQYRIFILPSTTSISILWSILSPFEYKEMALGIVQKRAVKLIANFENLTYEEKLKEVVVQFRE